jgi:hypothetical protein
MAKNIPFKATSGGARESLHAEAMLGVFQPDEKAC